MDRRQVVRSGGSLVAFAFAGCLGEVTDPEAAEDGNIGTSNSTESDTDPSENTTEHDDDEPIVLESPESGPVERVSVASTRSTQSSELSTMHRIVIENARTEPREIEVHVEHDGTVVYDEEHKLKGETALTVAVDEPGTYRTTVESADTRSSTETLVSADCDSQTVVSFGEDGELATSNERHC